MQETEHLSASDSLLTTKDWDYYGILPQEPIDTSYWFSDFAHDAWVLSKDYQSNQVYFEGETQHDEPGWLLFVLLFCFSLIAFVRAFHRKRMDLISKILLNWKLGKQIIRYEKVYTHPVNLALILNYLIVTPLFFATCFLKIFSSKYSLMLIAAWLLLGLLTFQVLRFLAYSFSAWIFEEDELVEEYVFHVNLLSKFQGLVFFILLILSTYSGLAVEPIFWIGIGTLTLSSSIQLVRGLRIGIQKSKNLILIILYLCTLEILPLLVLIKLAFNAL